MGKIAVGGSHILSYEGTQEQNKTKKNKSKS
jgi:hypothetical protein